MFGVPNVYESWVVNGNQTTESVEHYTTQDEWEMEQQEMEKTEEIKTPGTR